MSTPNWDNRTLFRGDNLAVLRGMDSETVDLIATDPPFNKNKDFHATPDSLAKGAKFQDRWSWARDVQQDWVDQISDDYPRLMEAIESARYAHSDGMGAFMCFMAVRLLEMRRILRPTGSIYLHCDRTASHYLKAVMDAIFGQKQFRNQIIWCYSTSGRSKRTFAQKHDVLLFYSRSKHYYWSDYRIPVSQKYLDSHYRQLDAEGRRCRIRVDHGKTRTYYPEEGMICNDWWTEFPYVNSQAKERTGYPTQKPIDLYKRIITASSKEGSVICDPFAGCATTLVAAEGLGRQWVGIDIWERAHEVVIDRLETEGLLSDSRGGADHLSLGDIHYVVKPPDRTDGGEIAAPFLRVTQRRAPPPLEPWQKMSRAEIVRELTNAQSITDGLVLCAGCGRELEPPFMELDHIVPRSDRGENDISNRILLCRPCNGRKSARLTMKGLMAENRKAGWMKDDRRATHARDLAHERYEDVRYRRQLPAVAVGDLFD